MLSVSARSGVSGRRILVVDADATSRAVIVRHLDGQGASVDQAESWLAAKERCRGARLDAIVIDHALDDVEVVAHLPELRRLASSAPIVVLTDRSSVAFAVRALKNGAEHVLTKPVELPALEAALVEAFARATPRVVTRNASGVRRIAPDPFVGESAAIRRLRERAERLREGDRPVLILGETGTGKSVLARWLHGASRRAGAPLVDLNCAALSRELLESELFGHERGAFTGAANAKIGLVEAASGGTLFLDEIGDMDLSIQPKLLKVLEEGSFRRLGDVRDRMADVRLVSATHQDLGAAVRTRAFRADLFYRISAFPVSIPPLRERREDLPMLSRAIVSELSRGGEAGEIALSRCALERIVAHPWPGNIRELRNALERALWLAEDEIRAEHLDLDEAELGLGDPDEEPLRPSAAVPLTLREVEVEAIERALREEGGRVVAAARRLGVPRSSLYHKIKTLGLRASKR
jgi:DNA-binding NtrC family response regulator